jgi:soluble lytic murein transglycosylase-like protein
MRNPSRGLLPRLLLVVLVTVTGPSLFSRGGLLSGAERGPFGLEAPAFSGMVARDDKRAFLALEPTAFADPGPRGAATWFQAALWLETGGFTGSPGETAAWKARVIDLYFHAVESTTGFIRQFSLARLASILGDAARSAVPESQEARLAWEAILALPLPDADRWTGPGEMEDRVALRLEALAGLGRHADLLREAEAFARGDLGASAKLNGPALYALALAKKRLDIDGAAAALASLLALDSGPWLVKGIALASEPEAADGRGNAGVGPFILATARLRAAIEARDYGAAYRLAREAAPALRGGRADRALIGTFAKAYLYSGMYREGLSLMEELGAAGGPASPGGSPAWTAAFYKARMLHSLARDDEAAALFARLRPAVSDPRDSDSTLWYELDSRFQGVETRLGAEKDWVSIPARDLALARAKIGMLTAASRLWDDPLAFADLATPLLRQLILDRDWKGLEDFALQVSASFGADLAARSQYLAGRARELGLVVAPPLPLLPVSAPAVEAGPARLTDGNLAAARYAAVLALPGSGDYYRLVAATRLGRDLPLPTGPPPAPPTGVPPWTREEYEASRELASVAGGLIEAGLARAVQELAKGRYAQIAAPELRDLAEASARAGSPYGAMRFTFALSLREGLSRQELELLYPRPWLAETRAAIGDSGLPEALVFGLIRSESWFDPGVTSHAGAVGLAQLMPATAAEIAARLRLRPYSLTDPADNLRLGIRMFRDLMVENQGHALRALFAYNAGKTRLKRWIAESGGLPDDLFLETLSIDETRQYGRNIVVATAWYGALHYGRGTAATVGELLGGIEGLRK